tara:strand:- start:299 stop:445 length:147 start_codon:yes stop_codon:yes gene_type:complete
MITKEFLTTLIIIFFLVSCNYNQNVKEIPKKSGSNLKVTIGGVKAKID